MKFLWETNSSTNKNNFNRLMIKLYFMGTSEQEEELISYEQFSKIHLKIGKVIRAENVPGMKKIFKVTVDIGEEQRDLAVGAALHYNPEELIGRAVVVCTNLEPKKIGGIISNGMLLAADGPEERPVFLTVTENVSNGSLVR